MEERLALMQCPVAVVSGSRDPIVPRSWLLRLEQARDGVALGEVPAAPARADVEPHPDADR